MKNAAFINLNLYVKLSRCPELIEGGVVILPKTSIPFDYSQGGDTSDVISRLEIR